jgi:hypothetical protein
MPTIKINDCVHLKTDIPELALHRGDSGIVQSTWFAPTLAYEVEFDTSDSSYCTRALLLAEQVELPQTDTGSLREP